VTGCPATGRDDKYDNRVLKISVIVVNFYAGDYLQHCIDSLIAYLRSPYLWPRTVFAPPEVKWP